uniref:Arp2/3 complex 34 kDa subunit n=1 Tax=Panagrellus redivivus TaxID=6233 RepID=A0A7E4ZZD8_PANRE
MKFDYSRNEPLFALLTTRFRLYLTEERVDKLFYDIPMLGGDTLLVSNPTKDHKTIILVSLKAIYFDKLQNFGLLKHLQTVYSGYVSKEVVDGYVFTLEIDLTKLPKDPKEYEALADHIARIRKECFAPIINHYFDLQVKYEKEGGEAENYAIFDVMKNSKMIIDAKADRVTMVFAMTFDNELDVVLAKLFLDEFTRQTVTGSTFRVRGCFKELPDELKEKKITMEISNNVGYFVVVCRPRHNRESARGLALDLLLSITEFMCSHIDLIKVKTHRAWRQTVGKFVKSVARARPNFADDSGESSFSVKPMFNFAPGVKFGEEDDDSGAVYLQ